MTIDIPDDDPLDVASIAAKCRASVFGGLSKLSTQGCPADCAIVVDNQCAGRTPADDRAMTDGRKRVVVVCDGKTKKSKRLRFKDGATTTFSCR